MSVDTISVDFIYRISIFGDFKDIKPEPDTLISLMTDYKEYGFVPSVVTGVDMLTQIPVQYISLSSSGEKVKLIIGPSRVDYEVNVNDDNTDVVSGEDKRYSQYIDDAKKILRTLMIKYGKSANRLALFTGRYLVKGDSDKQRSFLQGFTNPIEMYNVQNAIPSEWSTHLMITKDIKINGATEKINIITDVSKVMFIDREAAGKAFDSFQITLDINTVVEQSALRFSPISLSDFLDEVLIIRKEILKDMR